MNRKDTLFEEVCDIIESDYHPDINTDQEIRKKKFDDRIESLLKEQRSKCLDNLLENSGKMLSWKEQCNLILNAPEPEVK